MLRLVCNITITEQLNEYFQDKHFQKAYDSVFMAISFVFINFSQKVFFNRKLTLKMDSAASTGSHGNYINVSFLWPPVFFSKSTA
jgi:hypothetical protein